MNDASTSLIPSESEHRSNRNGPEQRTIILDHDLQSCLSHLTSDVSHSSGRCDFDDFDSEQVVVHGRAKEVKLLFDTYNHLSYFERSPSRFFLVRGSSGTGKTTFIEILRKPAVRDGAFVVGGTFDMLHRSQPHSAFVSCLTDLCDLLAQCNEKEEIKHEVVKALEIEGAKLLASLIYNLPLVSGIQPDISIDHGRGSAPKSWNIKLHILCCTFLRTVAKCSSPILLILDDIHRCDDASVDLLSLLLSDRESSNILIVGTYQGDCCGDLQQLSPKVQSLINLVTSNPVTCRHGFILPTINVELKNLQKQDVASLLADLCCVEPNIVEPLAEVIYRKTQGLPSNVRKFLDFLRSKDLLKFSVNSWEWDIDRIQAEADVSDNVAELLSRLLHGFTEPMQLLLKIAACIGYTFNIEYLIMASLPLFSDSPQLLSLVRADLYQMVGTAIKFGLLEKVRTNQLKFSHPRVCEAAYRLTVSSGEAAKLHFHIGSILAQFELNSSYEEITDVDLVFLVVGQLNRGSSAIEGEERVQLAHLNCTAGHISQTQSNFVDAAMYYHNGIGFLSDHPWDSNYKLTLKLKTGLAEMQFMCDTFGSCQRTVYEVAARTSCVEDRMPAYFILMSSLMRQGKMKECISIGLEVRKELGERLPSHQSSLRHISMRLFRTEFATTRKSKSDLLNLPPMTDDRKLLSMKTLSIVSATAYYCIQEESSPQMLNLFLNTSLRMMQITLRCGLSEHTSHAFTSYAVALSICVGHVMEATRFASLAMELMHSAAGTVTAPTLVMLYSLPVCLHRKRLRELVHPFFLAYTIGMQTHQDASFSMLGAVSRMHVGWISGSPLLQISEDIRGVVTKSKKDMQCLRIIYGQALPLWQAVSTLMGTSESEFELRRLMLAEVDDAKGTMEHLTLNNDAYLDKLNYFKMVVGCFFGDWSTSLYHLEGLKIHASHFSIVEHTFFTGLISLVVSQHSTYKRKHIVEGRKQVKMLRQWLKHGSLDCKAMLAILEAEEQVLRKADEDVILGKFKEAILEAHRSEFTHLAALATERLAIVLKEQFLAVDIALELFEEAKALYNIWGAHAKVRRIETLCRKSNWIRTRSHQQW